MKTSECIELMQEHSIRPTANRILIVKAMSDAGRPMSLTELEIELPTIDKSIIFRSLSLFKKNSMLHIIEDWGHGVRYELCHSHSGNEDDDMHVHFHCEVCKRTYCLEEVQIPEVRIPEGYVRHSANYIIKGICPECSR